MTFLLMESLKADLIKSSFRHFQNKGWQTKESTARAVDFFISRGEQFKFAVQCIDKSALGQISVPALVEDLESQARYMRTQRGMDGIFLFNFYVPSIKFTDLAKQKIVAVHLDEADVVSLLPERFAELSVENDPRQRLMCANRPRLCMALARSFKESGHEQKAMDWYRTALSSDPDFSAAALELADALLKLEDFAEAEKVLRGNLKANKANIHLLRRLRLALEKQGKTGDALQTQARIAELEASSAASRNSSFDVLSRRSDVVMTKEAPTSKGRGIGSIFGRILSKRGGRYRDAGGD